MKALVLSLIFLAALSACHKTLPERTVPAPVNELVFEFRTDTLTCQSGAYVKEYLFQEKPVYLFNAGPCIADGSCIIYDADGEMIGNIGGWAGWNVNGIPFYPNATLTGTVWHN